MQILVGTSADDTAQATHLTVAQAATHKGVTYQAMLMWLRNNEVPVERIGSRILISKSDLERYTPHSR